ncbi:MAG TPA: hypothetical protein VJ955_03485 [Desulfuromonadales bacterium]|nr:hypothetical protein [Desulfuromonadales bacterium]
MTQKDITLVFYGRDMTRDGWDYSFDETDFATFLSEQQTELARFGITLRHAVEDDVTLEVKGYGDLLNTVRLRSPADGICNLCLGHIIGQSPNRNLIEDIRRGISRVAFAPETIEPEGSDKIVCHNCGCGC